MADSPVCNRVHRFEVASPYDKCMEVALPDEVRRASQSYLDAADRLLPGAITSVAVGGSVALGAYRPKASDIDLIATLDDAWRGRSGLIPRLRALHLSQLPRLLGRAVRGMGISACCNTSFVWASEISRPVTQIEPIASHVGELFNPRGAFDVNPVIWHELQHGGIALRGGVISTWGLDPESDELLAWTLNNLLGYWKPLMLRTERRRGALGAGRVQWRLLGPARMHATLATGDVISKQEAGERALTLFPHHAPILGVALAHLRGEDAPDAAPRSEWRRLTVACMREIISESEQLPR